jgi:hypothetical protein
MKQLYIIFAILLATTSFVSAQMGQPCKPDESLKDSLGVFPLPFDSLLNPQGGVKEIACLGKPYETVFTVAIGGALNFSGTQITIDSIRLATTGAVKGLPAGLTYQCSTPNCTFRKGTLGCFVIKGTTSETNIPGGYPLTIQGTVFSGVIPIDLTFPNELIAIGTYSIRVASASDDACVTSSLNEVSAQILSTRLAPNPVAEFGILNINAQQAGRYQFSVFDLFGRAMSTEIVFLQAGENQINLDANKLPNGMYIFSLNNGNTQVSQRFVVKK